MDDLLLKVISRLLGVYENLGEQAFRNACHQAMVGAARASVEEAERLAGGPKPKKPGLIIRFPLDKARQELPYLHEDT